MDNITQISQYYNYDQKFLNHITDTTNRTPQLPRKRAKPYYDRKNLRIAVCLHKHQDNFVYNEHFIILKIIELAVKFFVNQQSIYRMVPLLWSWPRVLDFRPYRKRSSSQQIQCFRSSWLVQNDWCRCNGLVHCKWIRPKYFRFSMMIVQRNVHTWWV